jgi:hypothetical protein
LIENMMMSGKHNKCSGYATYVVKALGEHRSDTID